MAVWLAAVNTGRNALTGINRILTSVNGGCDRAGRSGRNALTGINRILTSRRATGSSSLVACSRNALTGINRILTPPPTRGDRPTRCRNALTGINRILTECRVCGAPPPPPVVMPLRALIGL